MAKSLQAKSLIRQMAQDAKSRMVNGGYYKSLYEQQALKRTVCNSNNLKLFSSYNKSNITIKIINQEEDVCLKNKIYNLLKNNADILNPLKELINDAEFNKLTEIEKEKYILEVSEKFVNCKNKYFASL